MSAAINVERHTVDETETTHPLAAASLRERGWRAMVFLDSAKARTGVLAYEDGQGRLRHVYGSRALFQRYVRETGRTELCRTL